MEKSPGLFVVHKGKVHAYKVSFKRGLYSGLLFNSSSLHLS